MNIYCGFTNPTIPKESNRRENTRRAEHQEHKKGDYPTWIQHQLFTFKLHCFVIISIFLLAYSVHARTKRAQSEAQLKRKNMSNNEVEARRAVTAAIASSGSAAVGQVVDTGRSSQQKRQQNRELKAAQLAREKEDRDAEKAKSQGTVSQLLLFWENKFH